MEEMLVGQFGVEDWAGGYDEDGVIFSFNLV